jgi:hypothetical protein
MSGSPTRDFRPGEQHPEKWRADLNPEALAGTNTGSNVPRPELTSRTAFDIKALHRMLDGITDDGLRMIPVLPMGARLEQGVTHVDLRDPDGHEFSATADMRAGPRNWYVPKSSVDYELWNRLLGITNPERLGPLGEIQPREGVSNP